jgi:N utilization substance protein B
MRSRTKARAWALQVLYAWEIRGRDAPTSELEADLGRLRYAQRAPDVRDYARRILRIVEDRLHEIDARIEALASNWRLSRMTTVDRNILRIAAAEMVFLNEIPPRVSIQEAIRLAEWFGTEESARFINGILDALLHELEPERLTDRR